MNAPADLSDASHLAEQAVIGAALLDGDAVARCRAAGLVAADFADAGHRVTWAVLDDLHRRGEPVEVIGVWQGLQARAQADLAGGLQYLNGLLSGALSAHGAEAHARRIHDAARRRTAADAAERLAAELRRPDADLGDAVRAAVEELRELAESAAGRAPPFVRVPMAQVLDAAPPAPAFWWGSLVPEGCLTLWSGHGGSAKSYVGGLMLAVSVALGRALFGEPVRRGRVAFFSAEDSANVTRYRLHAICRGMGLTAAELGELDDWLHVLDATVGDPTLFHEVQAGGVRYGEVTPGYGALRDFLQAEGVSVLIVDNSSDTYGASEIDRARVRGFMRALVRLVPEDGAVVLLAHVSKVTSRGGSDTESYSGSTAWHNSARSRIAQSRDKDGALVLQHEKSNHGPLHAPIRLTWPDGGIPQLEEPAGAFVQGIADRNDTQALLRLIAEFTARGEFVSSAQGGPTMAPRLLSGERGYPEKRSPGDVMRLLREAERRGHLERVPYRTADRKDRPRWQVTPTGAAAAGIEPLRQSAPVCASPKTDADTTTPEGTAPVSPSRGVGGLARAPDRRTSGAAP